MFVTDSVGSSQKLYCWFKEYRFALSPGAVLIDLWVQANIVSCWPIYMQKDVE